MKDGFFMFLLAFLFLMSLSPTPDVFATYNPVAQFLFLVAACGMLMMTIATGILMTVETMRKSIATNTSNAK